MMLPTCNNCSRRECTRKEAVKITSTHGQLCRKYLEPKPLRVRFIAIAMWGELLKWGEIRNASRLRFVAKKA